MVYWDEFSTYFHACPSVKVVKVHVLLKVELSKEKMNAEKLMSIMLQVLHIWSSQ